MTLKGLIRQAITNRRITLFMVALLLIMGSYSYYLLPKQEAPDVSAPVAIITTIYPGAAPGDVEKLVTSKIEEEVATITGFHYSTSTSSNSLSVVIPRLDGKADIDKAWAELRQKMQELQSELPEGCEAIQINSSVTDTAGMLINIWGAGYSHEQLAHYANEFKKELARIPGVARFEIRGEPQRELVVEVDRGLLNHYHLSLADVAGILRSQNTAIPSGALKDGSNKINVTINDAFGHMEHVANTVVAVSGETGAIVRLKDIAQLSLAAADTGLLVKQEEQPAVLLTGYFKENENVVLVGKQVEDKIAQLKLGLPQDIQVTEVMFQPRDVRESVSNFSKNLFQGIGFVMVVILVGMSLRNALVVSVAIPLSILITFALMPLLGIKIHLVSIAALIIALGMLVDNAIVISDAIQVRIDQGQNKLEACLEGVGEVAQPVFASTLTTIGAFTPLLMLPSVAGDYIKSIPQILIISLLASYGVALFVIPTLAYMFFQPQREQAGAVKLRELFISLLEKGIGHKLATVLVALTAFGGALLLANTMGLEFFPKDDKNIVYIDVKAELAGDLAKTQALAEQVTNIIAQQEEVLTYSTTIGGGFPKFYTTMPPTVESADRAQVLVRVDLNRGQGFASNTELVDYLQHLLNQSIVGGTAAVKQLEQGEPIGAPITARISGEDLDSLQAAAGTLEKTLGEIPGTTNVTRDAAPGIYEYHLVIDSDKASKLGISHLDIQREVSIALRGAKAAVLRQDGTEYPIVVKSSIRTKEELENLAIKSVVTGNKVLLKELAQVGIRAQAPEIRKYNGEMAITIYSDVQGGYSSVRIQEELLRRMTELELTGVQVSFEGEKEKINENFGDMGYSAVLAVLMIYGILLFQFKSFIQPIVVLLTIPLSVIGSILGLFVAGKPISFMSLLGMVSLLGIVVNNAIVLLDLINSKRRLGIPLEQACVQGMAQRFRPILISTVTTAMGLIPLMLSGSNLFSPMAISLMSGLMISTLLTLVIIPVVYCGVEQKISRIGENRCVEEKSLEQRKSF